MPAWLALRETLPALSPRRRTDAACAFLAFPSLSTYKQLNEQKRTREVGAGSGVAAWTWFRLYLPATASSALPTALAPSCPIHTRCATAHAPLPHSSRPWRGVVSTGRA